MSRVNDTSYDADHPKETLWTRSRRTWREKTGIDWRTARQLFKGAAAPTICMAAYQATPWAETYTTLGYLVTISAVLSTVIAPRAKFLQNLLANVLAVCVVAAVVLFAMFCAVQARLDATGEQTPGHGGPGTSGLAAGGAATAGYNSSASAVAGVMLFVLVYGISVIRAKLPQYTVSCILAAIFVNVGMIYAPQFNTMAQSEAFAQRLLTTFLTGFAIAAGVSLFVFPVTSRQIVFKQMGDYLDLLQSCVQANVEYMRTMEEIDVFSPHRINTLGQGVRGSNEADRSKSRAQALTGLHAKLHTELPFAKREIAMGKLGPDDIKKLFKMFRSIMVPVTGLSSLADVFQRIGEEQGWDLSQDFANVPLSDACDETERARVQAVQDWHQLMAIVKEPFRAITDAIREALEHAAIVLQFKSLPKQTTPEADDAEKGGARPLPGTKTFAAHFNTQSLKFTETKKQMLRGWCEVHNVRLPERFFDEESAHDVGAPDWMNEAFSSPAERRLRRQLFMCLYMQSLLFIITRRVYELVVFAEELEASGKLAKTRLVVPGFKRLRKWIISTLSHEEDAAHDTGEGGNTVAVYLGEAYHRSRSDPEHLPPATRFQRWSNHLRAISHFLASPSSAFGFRVACATMSIAVISFLQSTQTFFTRYRLFWAQIMIAISMAPSAGASLRAFLLRITGTILYYGVALVAYYIVDGHVPGVIVFYALFVSTGVYIIIKYPAHTPVGMIGQVTLTLIIGYELQVEKIGVAIATSNGQEYQPIYILGLIRVATVCGGLFVAWIWTIFPYPITEHSQLRTNLGKTLYLLANYYSLMHETFKYRLSGDEDILPEKERPGHRLDKARHQVFAKCTVLISSLRAQVGLVKLDVPIGGEFPKKQYEDIIGLLQSSLSFMSLVVIASEAFAAAQRTHGSDPSQSRWVATFRKLVREANVTSQAITTLLSLLSAAITNGQALPPYIKVPEPTALIQRLDELDKDILSIRHIAEPGYASFAVVHISLRLMTNDLKKVLGCVKELVGELDFAFHIEKVARQTNESEETLTYTNDSSHARTRKQD